MPLHLRHGKAAQADHVVQCLAFHVLHHQVEMAVVVMPKSYTPTMWLCRSFAMAFASTGSAGRSPSPTPHDR